MEVVTPKNYSNWNILYWVGIPLALFLLFSSIFVSSEFEKSEYTHLNQQLHDASTLAVNHLEFTIEGHVKALLRMGSRLDDYPNMPRDIWQQDALNYYNDMPVFEVIAHLDRQMHIISIVPANKNLQDLDLANIDNMSLSTYPGTVNSKQHSNGFLIIIPLHAKKEFNGYLLAKINVEKILKQLFSDISKDYEVAIYQGDDLVYSTINDQPNTPLISSKTVKIFNAEWKFYIWPTEHLLNMSKTGLPRFVLISGIITSILVIVIFYFYSKSRSFYLKSQRAQLESERIAERMQKIIERVNEGFLSFDENGILTDWNPYAEKVLGWTKEEALGKVVYDFVLPQRYKKIHTDIISHFMQTNDPNTFNREIEFTAVKRDGTEFPIEVVVLPLKVDGKYIFYAFVRDITVRRKLELDQARLTSIINSSNDAILSTNLEGKIITWNSGAEKLYGYKAEEVIGKTVDIIYLSTHKQDLNVYLDKINKGENIKNNNALRLAKNGNIIPVSVAISPIRDKRNVIIGMSSIARDMTERFKIEKMKNEFISTVSHELRTPLTSIRGALGLLEGGKVGELTDKAKHLVEIASHNCERLVRLINDMLDIEKIEAGKMDFKFKKINLNALINECIESNHEFAVKYDVKLVLSADQEFEVFADYDRLSQVVTNLISNAVRYSPKGGTVTIAITYAGKKVRVSVIDNGPGVPSDFGDKIFGKFSQADASATKIKGGTGLGLNISKAIVEKHGGTITYKNQPLGGAIFYFNIPQNCEKETSLSSTDSTETHEKILICDPNFDSADYLKTLLAKKNINADIANTAKQARALLKQNQYSLITIDLMLPDEDGITFIKSLKQDEETKSIPVVVISVQAREEWSKINGDGFQVADWIEKPVNEEQFLKVLEYLKRNFSNKIPNILSVEDDNDVTQLITIMLQGKANVWNARTIKSAKKYLEKNEFDLIILDLNLPDGIGTNLLPCVNYKSKELIPVIVFSVDQLDKKYSHLVRQSLLKSQVTNEQLYNAIESAFHKGE